MKRKAVNDQEGEEQPAYEELYLWPIPLTGVGSVFNWESLRTGELDTKVNNLKTLKWRTMLGVLGLPYTSPPEFSITSFLLRGIHGEKKYRGGLKHYEKHHHAD